MKEIKLNDLIKDGKPDIEMIQNVGLEIINSKQFGMFEKLNMKVLFYQDLYNVFEQLGLKPMSEEEIKEFVNKIKEQYKGNLGAMIASSGASSASADDIKQDNDIPAPGPDATDPVQGSEILENEVNNTDTSAAATDAQKPTLARLGKKPVDFVTGTACDEQGESDIKNE